MLPGLAIVQGVLQRCDGKSDWERTRHSRKVFGWIVSIEEMQNKVLEKRIEKDLVTGELGHA